MKKALLSSVFSLVLLSALAQQQIWINGYQKRDGSHVQGHWRRTPGPAVTTDAFGHPYSRPENLRRDRDGDGLPGYYDPNDRVKNALSKPYSQPYYVPAMPIAGRTSSFTPSMESYSPSLTEIEIMNYIKSQEQAERTMQLLMEETRRKSPTNLTNPSIGSSNYVTPSSSSDESIYNYSTSNSYYDKRNAIIRSTQKNTYFLVESSSPIHAFPDKYSRIIGTTNTAIIFEDQVDNDFVKVNYKGHHAYLDKMWIDIDGNMKTINSRKYANLVGKEVPVFLYSPIYKYQSTFSEIVGNADNKKVIIIEEVNDEYFLVKYHNVKGYMPKQFVDN